MKPWTPVTQEEFSDPERGVHGNCLSACLEAITGEQGIPNFAQHGRGKWFLKLWEWADERGWLVCSVNREKLPLGVVIVQGNGPRGFKHACLWAGGPDGMLVWDPHPDRTGLVTLENWIRVEKDVGGSLKPRRGPPNVRAGELRSAMEEISRQTACGWTRRAARGALTTDDKRRIEERGDA